MANILTYTIIFGTGGAYFTLATIVAFVVAVLIWLWRKRISPALFSTLQFLILAGAWWLMLLEWWPKQRKDGREFPWYRDVVLAACLTLQTWIVAATLQLGVHDGTFVIFTTLGGAIALVLGNFAVYPQGWWGVGAYIALLAVVQFMILRGSQRNSWRAWAVYLTSLICVVGIPVVQLLSWTMTEALDKHPHRKLSEIFYLVVVAAGFTLNGIAATLFQSTHSHICDTVTTLPSSQEAALAPQKQAAAASEAAAATEEQKPQFTGASLRRRPATTVGFINALPPVLYPK